MKSTATETTNLYPKLMISKSTGSIILVTCIVGECASGTIVSVNRNTSGLGLGSYSAGFDLAGLRDFHGKVELES